VKGKKRNLRKKSERKSIRDSSMKGKGKEKPMMSRKRLAVGVQRTESGRGGEGERLSRREKGGRKKGTVQMSQKGEERGPFQK